MEVLLEPAECPLELAAWVTAFPVGVPTLPTKVAALIIVARGRHLFGRLLRELSAVPYGDDPNRFAFGSIEEAVRCHDDLPIG